MSDFVIFGTGSPILVDMEESLRRSGFALRAGIRNRGGACYLTDPSLALEPAQVTTAIAALPFLVPLFTPSNRWTAVREAWKLGFSAGQTLVDPSVALPGAIELGEGGYFGVGSTFGACSRFGRFTFVNRGASVGHHFSGGNFVSIGPGAVIAGGVSVGAGTLIGAGAVILPQVRIGDHAIVGAGAVVTRDVPDRNVVVGNPASGVRDDLEGFDDCEGSA